MQNRRIFLKKATLATGALSLFSPAIKALSFEERNAPLNPNKKRALRIAHITDVHVMNTVKAIGSFTTVINEINSLEDKPDFIINSGDTVMNMNHETKKTVETHWKAWDMCMKNNQLPHYACIGNHDVWYLKKEQETPEIIADKFYQKNWVINKLQLPNRYYSFTKANWKFIALDSISHNENGYQFDAEQLVWLDAELAAAKGMQVCIFSHVPIMSLTPFLYMLQTDKKELTEVKYPGGDLHTDMLQVKDILYKYKNVKLALSGHVHYIDVLEYLGTKYICGGAVSSNWWNGVLAEFPNAYGIVDLYEDGSSNHGMVFYPATV